MMKPNKQMMAMMLDKMPDEMMDMMPDEMMDMMSDKMDQDQMDQDQMMDGAEVGSKATDATYMDDNEILRIISAEMEQSVKGAVDSSESMSYYMGDLRGDEQEGRSQIISTDVADAIEWILPQIMKAMVAKGSVIDFDAISESDETQAELETEFTHDVFMKENEGFLNMYEFIKDALMHRNGIFKIYYDESEETKSESYDGLNQQEVEMLLQDPDTELVAMESRVDGRAVQQMQEQLQQLTQQRQQLGIQLQQMPSNPESLQQMQQLTQQLQMMQQQLQDPPKIISLTVDVTSKHGKVRVDCVDPDEFRVNSDHDSLNLDYARFTAHVRQRTRSDLIEEGYDPDIINDASTATSEYGEGANSLTDSSHIGDYSEDHSQQLIEISECYMMIDVDKTGIAKRMQITVIGTDDPTDVLEKSVVDESPFVSSSCIILAHRFKGLSIYDRLLQLQDMKTSLWRNTMDNLYLQNNREKEVVENQVNLDDLLVSRPGGIKRVKAPGMIRELQVQPIGQEAYQMLEYMDQVRTGRVGVSPDTAGNVDAIGTAVGSQGVAQILSAKEELTGLMVRVIAETGIKAAYMKIRNLLVKFQDNQTAFKFKGEWATVNPTQWGDRSRTTVKVGTGTGDDSRKVASIQQAIAYQFQMMQDPSNTLVDAKQIYSAMDEFCRVSGLSSASQYFLDPDSQEGQQKQKQQQQSEQQQEQEQQQLQQQMAQAQTAMGEGERMKGEAALTAQQAKLQVEQAKSALTAQKQASDVEKSAYELKLKEAEMELKSYKEGQQQRFEYAKLETDEALKLTEMELKYNLEGEKLKQQYISNQQDADTDDNQKGDEL